jgi:hypothetical protein
MIYILSLGHSGSTLLDLFLGSHSHIESGGEVRWYYDFMSANSVRSDEARVCTCGVNVANCYYWESVRNKVSDVYGKREIDLRSTELTEFEDYNYQALEAMLQVSKKQVFCDSSKDWSRLQNLLRSELFDVHVVHLVRDGRAVAYSNKKKGHGYLNSLRTWQKLNLQYFLELESSTNVGYTCVRYEDLVNQPQRNISKILEAVGLGFEERQLQFWEFDHHNLSGNRMRIKGSQPIKRDTAYLDELSNIEWFLGSTLAFSGLRQFGYSMWRK